MPCLRLHMPGGLDKKYLESDPEVIVENYEGLISDLLVRTTRPTKCVLAAAAQKAWLNVKQTEGNMWAERIAKAVSHCYNKRLQSSTGVRLKPSVRRVMATINKYCTLQAERKPVKEKSKRSLKKVESAASTAASADEPKLKKANLKTKMSTEDLRKMYGLKASDMLKSSSSMGPCMVESSSEEQQDAALPHEILDNDHVMPAKGTAPLQFWDNASLCMVRICQGQKIKATMKQHESGFLTAKFKGEPPIQTEVPNLVLKGGGLQVSTASGSKAGGKKCVKKPAASIPSMKKPAAASLPKESPEEEGPEHPEEDGEEGEDLQEAPAVAPPRCGGGGGGGGGPPDDEGFDNNSPMARWMLGLCALLQEKQCDRHSLEEAKH